MRVVLFLIFAVTLHSAIAQTTEKELKKISIDTTILGWKHGG